MDTRRAVAFLLIIVGTFVLAGILLLGWFVRDGVMEDGLGRMPPFTSGPRAVFRSIHRIYEMRPVVIGAIVSIAAGVLLGLRRPE